MIELVAENLPIASERKLKAYLAKSELSILRRVVVVKCQLKESLALKESSEADSPDGAKALLAVASMQEARRYQTFIDVLDEIVAQAGTEEHFLTVKLKTEPDYANTSPGQDED